MELWARKVPECFKQGLMNCLIRSTEDSAESNVNCGGIRFRRKTSLPKGLETVIVIFWQIVCLLFAIVLRTCLGINLK